MQLNPEKQPKPLKIENEGIYEDDEGNLELWIKDNFGELFCVMWTAYCEDTDDLFDIGLDELLFFINEVDYRKIKKQLIFH